MNPIPTLFLDIEKENLWNKERILERHEYLKFSGTKDTNIYYVVEGSLRVFIWDETEELTIRFGYQGNFISALDSTLLDRPSDLCIQALKKTRVKVIRKDDFETFVRSTPSRMALWINIMELLICQQLERERDILTSSPLERYQRVLQRSPQLFHEIPSKYIASYLRMTPETLSRLKKS